MTTRKGGDLVDKLDEIVDKYKKKNKKKKKRDWRTYEQQLAKRTKTALKELEPIVEESVKMLNVTKGETRGRNSKLTLKQKTILLLLKHLVGKSNREMSIMVMLFSALSGVDVSYKTIERLYLDEEVRLVLRNMHQLILKKKK